MMAKIKTYLSLIKFAHTVFAMPFALIGFFIGSSNKEIITSFQWHLNDTIGRGAENLPTGHMGAYSTQSLLVVFLLVILCMVFARSAAMAFNRYLDRSYDAQNPRTAIREIPKGIIKPNSALAFTIVNCILFVGTAYFINPICFVLSPIALFVVLGYSYTKRFTPLCHLVLGLGLSLAPIGAYLAVTGSFAWLPVLFSLAVLFWVSGFDIIYALQDVEFDRGQQLNSLPVSTGVEKALHLSELLHLLSAVAVVAAGKLGNFGRLYWLGVLVFGACLIYQHAIVKPKDLRRVNIAFMTTNGIASVVFALFVIADLFLR